MDNTGLLVRLIRTVREMDQKEMATRSGLQETEVSLFENGWLRFSERKLAAIEETLGISLDAIRPAFNTFLAAIEANRLSRNIGGRQ